MPPHTSVTAKQPPKGGGVKQQRRCPERKRKRAALEKSAGEFVEQLQDVTSWMKDLNLPGLSFEQSKDTSPSASGMAQKLLLSWASKNTVVGAFTYFFGRSKTESQTSSSPLPAKPSAFDGLHQELQSQFSIAISQAKDPEQVKTLSKEFQDKLSKLESASEELTSHMEAFSRREGLSHKEKNSVLFQAQKIHDDHQHCLEQCKKSLLRSAHSAESEEELAMQMSSAVEAVTKEMEQIAHSRVSVTMRDLSTENREAFKKALAAPLLAFRSTLKSITAQVNAVVTEWTRAVSYRWFVGLSDPGDARHMFEKETNELEKKASTFNILMPPEENIALTSTTAQETPTPANTPSFMESPFAKPLIDEVVAPREFLELSLGHSAHADFYESNVVARPTDEREEGLVEEALEDEALA